MLSFHKEYSLLSPLLCEVRLSLARKASVAMRKGAQCYSSSLSGRIRTQPCGVLLKLGLWEITSRTLKCSRSMVGTEDMSLTSALSNGVGVLQCKKRQTWYVRRRGCVCHKSDGKSRSGFTMSPAAT